MNKTVNMLQYPNSASLMASATFPISAPSFSVSDPSLYFAIFDVQFKAFGISSSYMKFTYAVSALPADIAKLVKSLIVNPPDGNPYELLKETLEKLMSLNEYKRIKEILRDENMGTDMPSCFLRRIQKLCNTNLIDNTELIRTYFVEKLPSSFRQSLINTSRDTSLSLEYLATLADDIYRLSPEYTIAKQNKSEVTQIENCSLGKQISSLQESIEDLADQVHDLKISTARISRSRTRSRGRSQSRVRNQTPARIKNNNDKECYYHRTYNIYARKCHSPCSWRKN